MKTTMKKTMRKPHSEPFLKLEKELLQKLGDPGKMLIAKVIGMGKGDITDYNQAKSLIPECDPKTYAQAVQWIAWRLGV